MYIWLIWVWSYVVGQWISISGHMLSWWRAWMVKFSTFDEGFAQRGAWVECSTISKHLQRIWLKCSSYDRLWTESCHLSYQLFLFTIYYLHATRMLVIVIHVHSGIKQTHLRLHKTNSFIICVFVGIWMSCSTF